MESVEPVSIPYKTIQEQRWHIKDSNQILALPNIHIHKVSEIELYILGYSSGKKALHTVEIHNDNSSIVIYRQPQPYVYLKYSISLQDSKDPYRILSLANENFSVYDDDTVLKDFHEINRKIKVTRFTYDQYSDETYHLTEYVHNNTSVLSISNKLTRTSRFLMFIHQITTQGITIDDVTENNFFSHTNQIITRN